MTIGKRIKLRRKELKITADELGAILGKDRSTIYRYEKGDIENMPIDVLEPIAKALQTTPAYLMGWEKAVEEKPVEMAHALADVFVQMCAEDSDFLKMLEEYGKLPEAKKEQVREYVHLLAGDR